VGGTPAGSVSAGTATKTDPNAFAVDILAPATTITAIQYVAETKVLKLTGTKFDEIGAAASDVKALVNWEQLVWDINGAGSGGVTFALADITSAIVTNGSTLTITLTAEKAAALEATVGFGASGADDNVDVAAGFAVDAAGNVSTTDSIANALAGYSDVTAPTVTSFTSSTSDGSFKQGADINITANLSEVVLAGSSITVTLDTGNTVELTSAANANSLTGTYTVPSSKTSSDLSVASFVVTTGKTVTDLYGNALAVVTIPSNVGDPNGISESATVSANANLLMSGTLVSGGKVVNAAAQKVVIKSVGDDSGITFKVTGTDASGAQLIETVTGASAGATATSVGFFKEVLEIKALGNTTGAVEAGTLTRGQNLNDNQALVIDTTVPTNTITEIKYDGANNQLIFTGANMDLVGAVGTDLKASMDWSKLVWDLDADASNDGVTFTASDITSAVVSSGTVLTVTLTAAKAAALESTVGFAHDGLTSTDTRDNIDVTAGFSVDLAGNAATTDGAANIVPTYSDTTAPTVTGFTSTNGSGSYKEGVQLNITANLDKAVVDGSSITVVLSTGSNETVVLTAAAIGTTMVGTYVVPSGVTSGDLAVSSFAVTTGKTVKSIYGPLLSNTTLPNGANLNDALDIIIDTSAPATTIASVAYSGADNQIVFTGTKFNNLAANNVEVKQHLDFSKLVWDLDGSASNAGVTFAASDFSSVKVTSATTLTAVLTTAKAAALEATVGFAADGLTATNAADQIDVATGFIRDAALNASTTDTAADLAVTYADTVKPTVSNFTSTTLDGGYKLDDEINITATMSEAVLGGSQLTVTLDSGGTALLTAAANGTTLTGTYTVGASNSSTDLNVSSYVITTAVSDLYGNTLSDTTLPASNLSNNKAITVDTTGPTNTISGVAYSSTAKTMTLAGAGFNTIDAVGTDVKSYLDWSKFVWDIDNSSSNAGITFSAGDITSAVITSATVMTITIKDAKAADMLSTVGFAADGLTATNTADNIDIAAGFSRDAAENASTTDAKADIVPTYSDTTAPTVLEFTSTTANGGYKAGDVINITATTSETVLAGSKIVVALNSGSGDTATLEASTNGNKMSGTYTVGAGDTSSDLSITQAFTVSSPVTDTYGNTLSVKAIPSGENLSDNSAIVIDTAIPTSTIASAKYDKAGGKITLTGANFTTVGASASDVKAQLDWTKFVWDLDGNASNAGVTFAVGDITSATITNATTMVIDLTAAKQLSLEATAGFGADGLLDTNTSDQIDIAAGFTRDAALNASTTDAAVNIVPTYADTARPTVSSFTSTTVDGSYNSGDAINITANMSEAVLGGSQMTVLLDSRSGNKVELTALQNGTTLVGTYTVAGADSSGDLKVSSYSLTDASGNLDSVLDVAGNAMSSVAIPGSQNLSDNSALVIDNVALFGNKTQNIGSSNPTQGETFALTFVESVKNTAALTAEVVGDAMFGATATPASTGWSNSDKTLTIALGAGETLNTNGQTFKFTSILDLADNESTDVIYTFEIA